MRVRWIALGLVVAAAPLGSARAQRADAARAGLARAGRGAADSASADLGGIAPARGLGDGRLRPFAPLASAALPGSGQYILGNDRFFVYAAAEIVGWWRFSKNAREQSQQEAAFKSIARTVARSHFTKNAPDGDWTYYETMRDFLESGLYSSTAGGVVTPESDTATYNGHLWQQLLATNATVGAALAQYETQAIKPEFQWSWRNAQLQYDQFRRTTDKRNDAHYAVVQDLIGIAANHVLSMVDAFATFRLQVGPAAGGGSSIGARVAW